MGRGAFELVLLIAEVVTVFGYNIDVRQPVARRLADLPKDSYFGYSVAQFKTPSSSWMIVGAPRGNTTTLSNMGVSRPGAIYRCGVTQDNFCQVIEVDTEFEYVENPFNHSIMIRRDQLDDQWLGCSVAAVANEQIVACAHRYVDTTWSQNKWFPVGRCSVLDKDFKVEHKSSPCLDLPTTTGVRSLSYCQAGTSVQMSQDSKVTVMGSPGGYKWQGVAVFLQTDTNSPVHTEKNEGAEAFDYMGYATDVAHFGWTEDYYGVVVGAPRFNGYFGRVVVFEYLYESEEYELRLAIDGLEFGEYFGHSVAAVDLNNDNFDDLLVGAPMYSNSLYEQGRVYVYMNNKKVHLAEDFVLTGTIRGGRFGHAIARGGDLNGDSFDDVVISAPYGENGGVIYIYHGSVGGMVETASQTIEARHLNYEINVNGMVHPLEGFGTSLSGGMDLDGNSYPDVLVGSYLSERVFLLRSRPVADVEGTVTFNPRFVNYPNSSKFDVELCIRYYGLQLPSQLDFRYTLSLEEPRVTAGLHPRAVFTGGEATKQGNLTTEVDKWSCKNFALELRAMIVDKVSPIIASLTYSLSPEGPLPSPDGNPDTTQRLVPVLRSQASHTNSSQAYLLRDCGEDIQCIPDLQIISARVNISEGKEDTIVIGEVTTITVFVAVRNVKENAYNARLIATFPRELTFTAVVQLENSLVSCDHIRDETTQVTCNLGNPFQANRAIEFGVRMGVGGLTASTQNFTVLLDVISDNPENDTTMADNRHETDVIKTVSQSVFGFYEGKANPDQLEFNPANPSVDIFATPVTELDIGRQVNHTYTVLNAGPSSVSSSTLVIHWPLKVKEGNGTYLLYIVRIETPVGANCETDGLVNPLNLLTTIDLNTEPTTTTIDSSLVAREKRTVRTFRTSRRVRQTQSAEEDCAHNSYASCVAIQCQLQHLDKDESAEVTIVSRLFERSLALDNIKKLDISSVASVVPQNLLVLDGLPNSYNLTTHITQPAAVTDESIEIWIIIVVVVVTVLLLVAVVLLLAFLGFFKRAKKDQLKKEKQELAAKGDPTLHVDNGDYDG